MTEETSGGGLGGGIIVLIIILLLALIIAGIWISLNIIGNRYPESSIGQKFNAWKEKRALTKE